MMVVKVNKLLLYFNNFCMNKFVALRPGSVEILANYVTPS